MQDQLVNLSHMGEQATKPLLLCVYGLQRSGNHAILNWLGALFETFTLHNDLPHDFFMQPANAHAMLLDKEFDCVACSFEDSITKATDPAALLLADVAPPGASVLNAFAAREVYILRDPYNTWASRVAANQRALSGGRGLTSSPDWGLFRANWLALAEAALNHPERAILFNSWASSVAYRETVAARFGRKNDDRAMEIVASQGQGSSFDGVPRPSYLQMLSNPQKYLSRKFLGRLASKPGYYLDRLIKPPLSGKRLRIDKRWEYLKDSKEGAMLFEDKELTDLAVALFGRENLPPIV